MDNNIKGYSLFFEIYNSNKDFKKIIDEGIENRTIRFFNNEEWEKINSQNFISPIPEMKEFADMFMLGYNIGNCGGAARQLSYSYDDVDIVTGILPILKGTLNAEKEGGHHWLERGNIIIDTTFMLIIDKSLKDKIGYKEQERLTSNQLEKMENYQARKEFTNDQNLRKKHNSF